MKKYRLAIAWIVLAITSVLPLSALADEVIPLAADSEGLEQFDKNVSQAQNAHKPATNFGSVISAEAKKLRTGEATSQMGKWVGNQRRHTVDPSESGTTGAPGSHGAQVSGAATLPNGRPRPNNAADPVKGNSHSKH